MWISEFSVSNYKSYKDSGPLTFDRGVNLVIGANNVGKTALLEALSLRITAKPHRSVSSLPRRTALTDESSHVSVTLNIDIEDLRDILFTVRAFRVPVPDGATINSKERQVGVWAAIESRRQIRFAYKLGGRAELDPIVSNTVTTNGYYAPLTDSGKWRMVQIRSDVRNRSLDVVGVPLTDPKEEYGYPVYPYLRDRIYIFRAERLNPAQCAVGDSSILRSDASNLPEVLNVLQSVNPERFNAYNQLVRSVIPSIYRVGARPVTGKPSLLELFTWTEDPATQRDDLTVPLSESGSGVGQVLAILYVALTAPFARVILIDEPNSFLHPGAARKLMRILEELGRDKGHQYIITTHSPEVIGAVTPSTVSIVEWHKPETRVRTVVGSSMEAMTASLAAVGAKLSDVFGANCVLWVEGQSEELVFRRLIEDKSIAVVAVRATGDFETKRADAQLIWQIYERLNQSQYLIPPALAFVFDAEGRTEAEKQELARRSRGRLRFLPRRMLENFALIPEAIAAVLNELPTFAARKVLPEEVQDWMITHGGEAKYIKPKMRTVDLSDRKWLENVDGAKILQDLFQTLSEHKEQFRKTTHTVALISWLHANQPEAVADLVGIISDVTGTC